MAGRAGLQASLALLTGFCAIPLHVLASCTIGSTAPASVPSPALAVCSAYTESSCCTMADELTLTLAVARSHYASLPSCHSLLLDLECGVSCHAQQAVFAANNSITLCSSLCTSLHAACATADNATAVPADTWCEGLGGLSWHTLGYNTTVVSDSSAVGSCFGGASLDGCDGIPNSGVVRDRCGVCGGDNSSCPVAGAVTVGAVRAALLGNLTEFQTASGAALSGLANDMSAQTARIGAEQARASTEHASNLSSTSSSRSALQSEHTASMASVSAHAAEMSGRLSSAQAASAASRTVLAASTATERTRVLTDYQRVNDSHTAHSAVSESVLAREMAAWASAQADVQTEIDRLTQSP